MLVDFRFAPADASIELPVEVELLANGEEPPQSVRERVQLAAKQLDILPCGVVFRLGKLSLPVDTVRKVAFSIVQMLRDEMFVGNDDVVVELENRPRTPNVASNRQVRTLLPHHDGMHATYFSPPESMVPGFGLDRVSGAAEDLREVRGTMRPSVSSMHKLYSGFFLEEPGEGLSVTTFYDLLLLLERAYEVSNGRVAASRQEIAEWLASNIRWNHASRDNHRSRYVALAAVLGSRHMMHHAISPHVTEETFTEEEMLRFPMTREFLLKAQGQDFGGPIGYLHEHIIEETLGMSWEKCRERYEVCVTSERHDLVVFNNVALVHGAPMGGSGRVLNGVAISTSETRGKAYERWLSTQWARAAIEADIISGAA